MDQLALLFVLLLGAVVTVPLGERLGLPSPVLMTLLGIVLALLPFVPNVQVPPGVHPSAAAAAAAVRRRAAHLLAAVRRQQTAHLPARGRPGLRHDSGGGRRGRLRRAGPADRRRGRARRARRPARPGRRDRRRRLARAAAAAGLDPGGRGALQRRHGDRALPRGDRGGRQRQLLLAARRRAARALRRGGRRVGLVLGWLSNKLMALLGDATLQIGLTLLVPFVSYVLAEELHGSGVLAVLTVALFLAEHAADADDVMGRLAGNTFWEIVDMLVTGVAFGLIGLELHNVFGTADDRVGEMLGWAGAVVVVVVGVRLL